jgi:hypothetical protein
MKADQLAFLVNFFASEDGLDFHSDEDTPTAAVDPVALEQGEAAPAAAQRTLHRFAERVVLKHTFRSQLATDILHALDAASGVRRGAPSSELGVDLSVRMATKLQKRPDLRELVDEEKVNAVAAKAKAKANKKRRSNDQVVEAVPVPEVNAVAAKANKKRRSNVPVVEDEPPPAQRQQVSLHERAATAWNQCSRVLSASLSACVECRRHQAYRYQSTCTPDRAAAAAGES